MRVVILWREDSDYARTVIDFLHDLEYRTGKSLESLSPDEPAGESLARAYDVVEYPSILALDSDGRLLQMWRGRSLPRIDDVSFYLMEQ